MNIKIIKLLLPHLRTISSLPDYAGIIRAQASQKSFDVRKDDVSCTTNFYSRNHSRSYSRGLMPTSDGKAMVLKPISNKDVKK